MEQKSLLDFLRTVPLFAKASAKALHTALQSPDAQLCEVRAGDALTARADMLGVLLSGGAQICSADDGKTVILRTLGAGDVFGAASLFLRDAPPLSQIIASAPSSVLLLGRSAVRTLMQQDEAFLDAYLAFLAGRVQFLNKRIRCFTAGGAERRLALWLAAEEHDTLTLEGSLAALSDTLDIGRASLYRALDKLQADGLILRQGRTITITSRERLLEIYQ